MPVNRKSFLRIFSIALGFIGFLPIGSYSQNQNSPASAPTDVSVKQLADAVKNKGWIVFCARSDQADWDLFLCRPDGSGLKNITHTPEYNEAAPQFSRDGRQLLYRRLKSDQKIDGNAYGMQGELMLAKSDGTESKVMGKEGEFPWASWSPDGQQIACLLPKGIFYYDIHTQEIKRRLERKGFYQQVTLSPDGKWFCGVANNFGTSWSVARLDVSTGAVNPVSQVDCCTPDWFPDSLNLIFSNRPAGQKGNNGYGWTQLWRADAEGKERTLVYGEDGRHVYGGQVSPDGLYALFTGNMKEDGDPENRGAAMGLMRLSDAPIVGGESEELRVLYPKAQNGPVLILPNGWEPSWTYTEIFLLETTQATNDPPADGASELAGELKNKGWLAFSAQTDSGDWDLFLMRPDSSEKRNITNTPEFNEAGVHFSPDGKKMFYYRMPKSIPLDNNTYGNQVLLLAHADGSGATVFGDAYRWAAWGGSSEQIAFLNPKGIHIVNLSDKKIVRSLPRKGFVQQLSWSLDEKWLCGTANGLGAFWSIGRMNAQTGEVNSVSEVDRYNCTPDWFADSQRVVYSRGIIPDRGGWAELWAADGEGKERRLLYAEDKRHMYGGALSPDDRYVLFTRSESDLGEVNNTRTRLAIIRLADTPMIGGENRIERQDYPNAKNAPILDLGWGWEPSWTYSEVIKSGE